MSLPNHIYSPLLDLTRIAMSLNKAEVGHTIDYHASIDSTMPIAQKLALDPSTRSGTLVIAEEQTAGQGRMQRSWEAPMSQGLLVSLILKGKHLPANPAHLAMLAGIAIARSVAAVLPELADEIGLKWPNDVLLGPDFASSSKVAGVLIETAYKRESMEYAIIGMGINVNQGPDGLPVVSRHAPPPTSLRIYVGRTIDRSDVLIALGQVWSELLARQSSHNIYQEWRGLLYTLGQPVTVRQYGHDSEQVVRGRAIDVTADGSLVVQDENGAVHTFGTGDVTTRAEDDLPHP